MGLTTSPGSTPSDSVAMRTPARWLILTLPALVVFSAFWLLPMVRLAAVGASGPADPSTPSAPVRVPSFGRSLGLFWFYMLLRGALWGVLWLAFWLVGVEVLLAALIAAVLAAPISWLLLARPRRALAANIEDRVNLRFQHQEEFNARLERDTD